MRLAENVPEWERWARRAEECAERCDSLPDACDAAAAWEKTLRTIAAGVRKTTWITPDQKRAVENIEEAVQRWMER